LEHLFRLIVEIIGSLLGIPAILIPVALLGLLLLMPFLAVALGILGLFLKIIVWLLEKLGCFGFIILLGVLYMVFISLVIHFTSGHPTKPAHSNIQTVDPYE